MSFATGDTTSKTVSIPITDDALVEGNETVNVALSTPTGGATLGSPATAVLTITDNDGAPRARLQFSAATYSVAENGGSATITVTRTGGSAGAVGVTFATSNGTATAGSDYTAVSQTVSFANGDTTSKTVSVSILNNGVVEPSETVNLTLSNPTGGATVGTPGSAVLTIVDDDSGSPALSVSPTTIARGSSVTASWSGIAAPTTTDWMALYAPGTPHTSYLGVGLRQLHEDAGRRGGVRVVCVRHPLDDRGRHLRAAALRERPVLAAGDQQHVHRHRAGRADARRHPHDDCARQLGDRLVERDCRTDDD